MSDAGKTLWVVYGEWGEYSDYRMWLVRGFESREEAERFKGEALVEYAAKKEARKIACRAMGDNDPYPSIQDYACTLDPDATACIDNRAEVRYDIEELPIGWPIVAALKAE